MHAVKALDQEPRCYQQSCRKSNLGYNQHIARASAHSIPSRGSAGRFKRFLHIQAPHRQQRRQGERQSGCDDDGKRKREHRAIQADGSGCRQIEGHPPDQRCEQSISGSQPGTCA
jgi:hypothetical protein